MSSRWPASIIRQSPITPAGPAQNGAAPGIWRMDEVAYWREQNLWPIPGVVPDPYFNNVTLLLSTTSLSNASNKLFLDNSGMYNPVWPGYGNTGQNSGVVAQGLPTPYGPTFSYYFDGDNDWIDVPASSQFNQNSAFTVEMWVNTSSGYALGSIFYSGGASGFLDLGVNSSTGKIAILLSTTGASVVDASMAPTIGVWMHLAMVSNGSTVTLYVDGVSQGSASYSGVAPNTAIRLGRYKPTGGTGFKGYMSNVRVVKGTAVYTANFTPPTAPLTVSSGTALLTCSTNRFQDLSPNNFTCTPNGNVAVSNANPFVVKYPGLSSTYAPSTASAWSGYFNGGDADWVSAPSNTAFAFGTGDFCMEAWVLSNANNSYRSVITVVGAVSLMMYNSGKMQVIDRATSTALLTDPTAFPLGRWVHVACSRESGTLRLFVNGALVASAANTTNFSSTGATYIASWDGFNFRWYGYISNARIVKGSAVYTSAFTPPTAPLTAISGTSLLTCQNSTFIDNSSNNFTLTTNGSATTTGKNPFEATGYWALVGATNQGGTIPQTTATDLGSGSFTIECWVNRQTAAAIVTKRRTDSALTGSWGLTMDANGYFIFLGVGWASTYTATTNPIPVGKWTHLAVSRDGTNLSMYVDGVRVYNTTDSYDYTCSTYTILKLWGNSGGNYPAGSALTGGFVGHLSNLRIVQGAAVYDPSSATLTVPTSPLTAISGTSLLTCQDTTLKDNSPNNLTITAYASSGQAQFSPFDIYSPVTGYGSSVYVDGNGTGFGSVMNTNILNNNNLYSDFTIEFWVYPTATYSDKLFVSAYASASAGWHIGVDSTSTLYFGPPGTKPITSTTIPKAGAWSHVAVTRSGSTLRMFLNGALLATTTYTTQLTVNNATMFIGTLTGSDYAFTGYFSDVRLSYTALYTSAFTPPTAPLSPSQYTRALITGNSARVYDASGVNAMQTVADTKVSTTVSKFGGSSVYFDGTGDRIVIPSVPALQFGTGNFTVEFWLNLTARDTSGAAIFNNYNSFTTGALGFFAGHGSSSVTKYQVAVNGTFPAIVSSASVTYGQWDHFAIVRNGNTLTLYINGVADGTFNMTGITINGVGNFWWLGSAQDASSNYELNGYIDDFRITKGVARYTSNFTPPTTAFPNY